MRIPPFNHGPPPGAVDIGHMHFILIAQYEGEDAGFSYYHLTAKRTWCKGWVDFTGSKWSLLFGLQHGWRVLNRDPLTIEPSLLCRTCADHGYIRQGRWVVA